MKPSEAANLEGDYVPLAVSAGRMSLEYVWAYPPGVPFLVPGEIIGQGLVELTGKLAGAGIALMSTKGGLPSSIFCAKPASTYL
jgi:arginine/lysine/ornithine decarboxylase